MNIFLKTAFLVLALSEMALSNKTESIERTKRHNSKRHKIPSDVLVPPRTNHKRSHHNMKPINVPPYAVKMEPLVQYSQRDPLYEKDHNVTAKITVKSKEDNVAESTNHVLDYFPSYHSYNEQEPIIEIIIKESNESLPTQPPPPPPPPTTKEPIQVFYVKYKKNPTSSGKEEVIYEEPIPALTPLSTDIVENPPTERYYNKEVVYQPPPPTTTLRTIIRPDSEIYHGSGLKVTFGKPDIDHQGYEKRASVDEAQERGSEDTHKTDTDSIASQSELRSTGIPSQQFQSSGHQPQRNYLENQGRIVFPEQPKQFPQNMFELRQNLRHLLPPLVSQVPSFQPGNYPQTPQTFSDNLYQTQLKNNKNLLHRVVNRPGEGNHPRIFGSNFHQVDTQSYPKQGPNNVIYSSQVVQHPSSAQVGKHLELDKDLQQQREQERLRLQVQKQFQLHNQQRQQADFQRQEIQRPVELQRQQEFPRQPELQRQSPEFRRPLEPQRQLPEFAGPVNSQRQELEFQRQFESTRQQPEFQRPLDLPRPQLEFQKPFESQRQQEDFRIPEFQKLSEAQGQQSYPWIQQDKQLPRSQEQRIPEFSTSQPLKQSTLKNSFTFQDGKIYKSISQSEEHQILNQDDFIRSIEPNYNNVNSSSTLFQLRQQIKPNKQDYTPPRTSKPDFSIPKTTKSDLTPVYPTSLTFKSTTSPTVQKVNDSNKSNTKVPPQLASLPDEVPDDLRQQLLASGILGNADIQILDYDKVGDIPIENLPKEALEGLYGAGSAPIPSLVRPNSPVEMKVVRYDRSDVDNVENKYIAEQSSQVDPVVLNDSSYNRYLPLKVSGANFPIPDTPLLKGKKISSVVVLAPVDYDFAQEKEERTGKSAFQIHRARFVTGDSLKNLVANPSKENFSGWIAKEKTTPTSSQSVILLVTGSEGHKNTTEKQIFMFDATNGNVNKLEGELSSAFVEVAESNAQSQGITNLSEEVDDNEFNKNIKNTNWPQKDKKGSGNN